MSVLIARRLMGRKTLPGPRPKAIHFISFSSVALSTGAQLLVLICLGFSVVLFDFPGTQHVVSSIKPRFISLP